MKIDKIRVRERGKKSIIFCWYYPSFWISVDNSTEEPWHDLCQWWSWHSKETNFRSLTFLLLLQGALLVKLFQYYKWTFVKFLYEDNPKPFQECQVLLRPIAHTFALNQIRSDNRKITSNDIKDNFKSIFIDFISNNASGIVFSSY